MSDRKAELITMICKECQKLGFTQKDLKEIIDAVNQFYFENAMP
ncbi:hypothetical protein [Brevibacillus fortis]